MVKKVATPADIEPTGTGPNENANNAEAAPEHETVARRAYELYCEWGLEDGNDLAHWFEAERQLKTVVAGPEGDGNGITAEAAG